MTRVVAVLVASRGDYWPLKPLLEGLEADPRFVLHVLVGEAQEPTDLDVDRQRVHELEGTRPAGDSPSQLDDVVAGFTRSVGQALDRVEPDLLVLLGDRYELLGAAAAALLHRVPVVHLNGGEITEGAHDDAVRHAVTKLAHLHLTAHPSYARRVIGLGEEPWRVHVVGEPGLDRLRLEWDRYSRADLASRLGVDLRAPVALLTYHPPTMTPELLDLELEAVLRAVDRCPTVVATHPSHEPGRERVLARLEAWVSERSGAVLVPALGALYPSVLRQADVMIGNSSSGIVEAPLLGLPVVNVGARQRGRVRADVVLDAAADGVEEAMSTALDPAFRARAGSGSSPYGDGHSVKPALDVLADADLERLLHKRFYEGAE